MELEYLKENIFDDLDFSDLDDDEIKAQEEIEINKSLKTIQKQDIANLIVDFNNTFNNIKDLKGRLTPLNKSKISGEYDEASDTIILYLKPGFIQDDETEEINSFRLNMLDKFAKDYETKIKKSWSENTKLLLAIVNPYVLVLSGTETPLFPYKNVTVKYEPSNNIRSYNRIRITEKNITSKYNIINLLNMMNVSELNTLSFDGCVFNDAIFASSNNSEISLSRIQKLEIAFSDINTQIFDDSLKDESIYIDQFVFDHTLFKNLKLPLAKLFNLPDKSKKYVNDIIFNRMELNNIEGVADYSSKVNYFTNIVLQKVTGIKHISYLGGNMLYIDEEIKEKGDYKTLDFCSKENIDKFKLQDRSIPNVYAIESTGYSYYAKSNLYTYWHLYATKLVNEYLKKNKVIDKDLDSWNDFDNYNKFYQKTITDPKFWQFFFDEWKKEKFYIPKADE